MKINKPIFENDVEYKASHALHSGKEWNWLNPKRGEFSHPANYYESSLKTWHEFETLNADLVCESLQVLAFPGVSFRYISHATLIEFECRPTALLADLTVGLRHHPSEVLWGVVVVLSLKRVVEFRRFGEVQRAFRQATERGSGAAVFEAGQSCSHGSE